MRRRGYFRATAAARSRKFSLTSRVAATKCARLPNDNAPGRRASVFAAPRRGDDAALLVPFALVLAAADRTHLLAGGADDHLGLHPILRCGERRFFCPSSRHAHRGGFVVGHPVPRPAWLLNLVP